jgi:CHAD domain-containing protein
MVSNTSRAEMYHLTPGTPVADGVRLVATDQLDRALAAIDDAGDDDPHLAVHEARKRCKKVRALLRLVRDDVPDTYDAVNTELRDTARVVSDERDAAAAVETHDHLVDRLGEEALAPYDEVRQVLVARRDDDVLQRIDQRLPEVRGRLAMVRRQVDDWALPDGDAVDVLRAGYARTYRRARTRWRHATEGATSHHWHEWRKRVKYNRYHTNLLQKAWPPVMELREELLHDLTDLLGDDHDLAELRSTLGQPALDLDEHVVTGYVGLLDGLRTRIQHETLPLAARCYGPPVDAHVGIIIGWWQSAVTEAHEGATDHDERTPIIPPGS